MLLQIPGCICPELGAHALIKVMDSNGDSLGECVVAVTDDAATEPITVKLSCGGKGSGSITGVFSMNQMTSGTNNSGSSRDPSREASLSTFEF